MFTQWQDESICGIWVTFYFVVGVFVVVGWVVPRLAEFTKPNIGSRNWRKINLRALKYLNFRFGLKDGHVGLCSSAQPTIQFLLYK